MELPLTYKFQGWHIRYAIIEPDRSTSQAARELKNVVFVHGTPWSSIVFRSIINALLAKRSFRVLIYDLPGYGQSQHLEGRKDEKPRNGFAGDTSVKFQARALSALLEHIDLGGRHDHPIPGPAVVAHDIAGAIVLRAHLLHNRDFESMILLDTNAVLPWGDGFYKLLRDQPGPFTKLPPRIFEAALRAVVQSASHNQSVLKEGWEDALAEPWIDRLPHTATRQQNFVRQIAQANDEDVREMLDADLYAHVRCDVMMVWGSEDQWIPREKMEELRERLGDRAKEFVVVPEAGHLVMLDQPDRVVAETCAWLDRPASSQWN